MQKKRQPRYRPPADLRTKLVRVSIPAHRILTDRAIANGTSVAEELDLLLDNLPSQSEFHITPKIIRLPEQPEQNVKSVERLYSDSELVDDIRNVQMKRKSTALTREERDILILGALRLNGKQLSNTEIGQRLGISTNRVKTIIHKACVKLGAHSRDEAIHIALKRGDIIINELYSLDELAELYSSLGPDMLRMMANIVRQGLDHRHLLSKDKQIICTDRRKDTILTNSERDVLILTSRGITNKEIADRLYVSVYAVTTFLNRVYRKLGVHKRADALMLALKQREINVDDLASFNELLGYLAPLGAESIDQLAQLMDQKLGQEPIPIEI